MNTRNLHSMLMCLCLLGILSFHSCASEYIVPVSGRQETMLDGDWRFVASDDLTGCETVDYDDRSWRTVQVPHSFQSFEFQDDYSHAWYRKHFTLPESDAGKRIYLKFDGAGIRADVYLNGIHLGYHVGAYTAFIFDITDAVSYGKANILAVRCDSKTPDRIRGNLSRSENKPGYYWNVVAGLHRAVHVLKTDPCHIDPTDHATSGIYVTPSNVTSKQADISIRTMLRNSSDKDATFVIEHRLADSDNRIVQTLEGTQSLPAGASAENTLAGKVPSPSLWSPDNPVLYRVYTEIRVAGVLKDLIKTKIGFRDFHMTKDGQFMLNGKRIRLIGASLHTRTEKKYHVYSEADARTDLAAFKDLGFNSIFLSHYPFPRHTMDLIDELGLLAWCENGFVNGSYEPEVSAQITRETIRQNYNYCSIYGWSVANEIEETLRIPAETLAKLAKAEDPSRLICNNSVAGWEYHNPCADLNSVTTFPGWYKGFGATPWALSDYREHPDYFQRQKKIIADEQKRIDYYNDSFRYINQIGGGSHSAMQQSYLARDFKVNIWEPEGYRQYLFESLCHQFYDQKKCEMFYFWQYKDQEAPKFRKRLNSKGIVSFDGWKKDDYYLIKSHGRPDVPVLHICGKHWFLRQVNELKVYSNSKNLSLMVNGKKHAAVENGAYQLDDRSVGNVFLWADILVPGRNEITVSDGKHEENCVIYYQNTPDEPGAPISNLRASNGDAYYINFPVQPQWPFHSTFDGTSLHTFDEIPDQLKNAGWISTRRQDMEESRTDLSFSATTDIDVYIMSDVSQDAQEASRSSEHPQWLSDAGFVDTGLRGQWRGDSLYLKNYVLYKKTCQKGSQVKLDTGKEPINYVVLVDRLNKN